MQKSDKNRLKKAKTPFTTIYNELVNDNELKLRDKGLYLFMLSKPNDWAFSVRGLASQCIEGRDSIARSLNNLIDKGWLRRYENRVNGKYKSYTYEILYAKSNDDYVSEISDSMSEKPYTEKRTISKDYNKKEREGNFYEQHKNGITLFIDENIKQEKAVRSKTGYKKSLIDKFMKEDAATIEVYSQWTKKYNVELLIKTFKGQKYKRTVKGISNIYLLKDIEFNNFEFVLILENNESGVRTQLRVTFQTFNDMKNFLSEECIKDAN